MDRIRTELKKRRTILSRPSCTSNQSEPAECTKSYLLPRNRSRALHIQSASVDNYSPQVGDTAAPPGISMMHSGRVARPSIEPVVACLPRAKNGKKKETPSLGWN